MKWLIWFEWIKMHAWEGERGWLLRPTWMLTKSWSRSRFVDVYEQTVFFVLCYTNLRSSFFKAHRPSQSSSCACSHGENKQENGRIMRFCLFLWKTTFKENDEIGQGYMARSNEVSSKLCYWTQVTTLAKERTWTSSNHEFHRWGWFWRFHTEKPTSYYVQF